MTECFSRSGAAGLAGASTKSRQQTPSRTVEGAHVRAGHRVELSSVRVSAAPSSTRVRRRVRPVPGRRVSMEGSSETPCPQIVGWSDRRRVYGSHRQTNKTRNPSWDSEVSSAGLEGQVQTISEVSAEDGPRTSSTYGGSRDGNYPGGRPAVCTGSERRPSERSRRTPGRVRHHVLVPSLPQMSPGVPASPPGSSGCAVSPT